MRQLSPCTTTTEPTHLLPQEKSPREKLAHHNQRKPARSNKDPAQPKRKIKKKKKNSKKTSIHSVFRTEISVKQCLSQLRITITKCHRPRSLHNRKVFSHSSGGWRSKTKVPAVLASSETSLPGLQTTAVSSHGLSSVQMVLFSRSVVSDSLQPHRLQHARLPCPSPSPRVCSS